MNDTAAPERWDIKEARSRVGNDEQFLCELLQMFLDSADPMMEGVAAAVKSKDGPGLSAAVHSIKGVLGNLSAKAAFAVGQDLDKLSKVPGIEGADALFEKFKSEVAFFKDEAAKYIAAQKAASPA